jgi:hypothetical protein
MENDDGLVSSHASVTLDERSGGAGVEWLFAFADGPQFHVTAGRRHSHRAFRSAEELDTDVERSSDERNDQRRNRSSRSSNLDDALARLERAALALYVEAAAVMSEAEEEARAAGRAHSVKELGGHGANLCGDAESRLEAFTRRVVERFDQVPGHPKASPGPLLSRF